MAEYDYDLITIGAGSGGVRASRMAAKFGAKVAVCEEDRVGGTCVLRGCVPKKLLVYGAHFADEFDLASSFGWTVGEASHDWCTLVNNKNRELDRLNGIYQRILRENGVSILNGRGRVVDDHTVEVAGKTHTAAHILLATGSWPFMPDIPGIEHAITSNEALDLLQLPERMVVVGGGYIAVEFAGIFNALGVKVDLVIRADAVLRGFDEDLRVTLSEEMTKRGITIHSECVVRSIEKDGKGYSLRMAHGDLLETDLVLYATGRRPKTDGLGLETIGVAMDDKGAVVVDEYNRTSVPSVYAVGDITNRMNLTPVALAEGMALANTLYNNEPMTVDYTNIATAVFSQPEVATVGLSEVEAREKHGAVDIYVSRFRPMKVTLSDRDERTFMKLVVDRKTDRVLGCHMVGDDAAEIVQGLAIALKCGATKKQFDSTIGIHPTAAEEFVTMREKLPDHG
ncbi:MAG: glutathione-disulfide reductase [Rhodospirillales bacterium]|nr:glutathione-disulfide reductase [Rhodospirillales bacterium]